MSFIIQPAAGGGTITLNAASAITAQRPVQVNTSGQAVEIGVTASTTAIAVGTAQTSVLATLGSAQWFCYDSDSDRFVVASATASAVTVAVLQMSNVGAVYGTGVAINCAPGNNRYIQCEYDATAKKVLIFYYELTTGYPVCVVGTVNAATNTITLGTPTVVESAARTTVPAPVFYNPGIGKCIVCWNRNAATNTVSAAVATISGTSVSFGVIASFTTPSTGIIAPSALSGVAHNSNGKFMIFCGDTSYAGFNACAATVSGTTITFGTPVQFNPWGWANYMETATNGVYDPLRNQFLFMGNLVGSSGGVTSFTITGTTTVNNIAITTLFAPNPTRGRMMNYNTTQNIINVGYSSGNSFVIPITNSGSAFTEGTATQYSVGSNNNSSVYDPVSNSTFFSNSGTGIQIKNGTSNFVAGSYVGISQTGVAGGSPCIISIIGATATVSGVVPGTTYAIQSIGGMVPTSTLTLGTYAGVGTASNTILLKG